ncbi:hypothetical protein FOPE_00081 [Fonsecaea pedrosoi]|nr:hypothetical protein FOPE_00081 [Fonsecaea pedrosoi]
MLGWGGMRCDGTRLNYHTHSRLDPARINSSELALLTPLTPSHPTRLLQTLPQQRLPQSLIAQRFDDIPLAHLAHIAPLVVGRSERIGDVWSLDQEAVNHEAHGDEGSGAGDADGDDALVGDHPVLSPLWIWIEGERRVEGEEGNGEGSVD